MNQARRPASPRRSPDAAQSLPPLPPDSLALALTAAAQAIAWVRSGSALNDGLASLWARYPELSSGGRGAVQDLVYGTLRDYGRADCLLGQLLQQPLTEPTIDGLLRVALHRLEQRPDSAHTVVDQAVEAAARIARGGLKGLVNGVLRNALRRWDSLLATCTRDEPATWRHPAWWIAALRQQRPQDWQAILEAGNTHPPMSLRINPRRGSLAQAQAALTTAGIAARELSPTALQLEKPVSVASLPGYAEGLLSVQDWGAQQAAALLDLQDGQRVLDACAAPGGKTAHMLECARLELLALDLDPQRAARVGGQLARLGLRAEVRAADCRRPAGWWDGRPFDRILADVPCSASGVARRHPDIKWLRQAGDVASFASTQREILDSLWPLLAPGGKMLYLTCSVFAEENSLQIARFAAAHAECERLPLPDGQFEQQLFPDAEHDGFYFALLRKRPA